MRSIIANIAALALTLAAGSVCLAAPSHHKQYRWHDASGNQHYSDTLTADALQSGYDLIDDKGVVLKHIDRARTDEERTAAEATAAAETAAKREAERRAEADRRLLAAFPAEKDLVRARQAQIDSVEQSIVAASNSLNSQEQALSDNLAHAATVERSGKKVPDDLKKQIESLRKSAESLRHYIERRKTEKVEAARKLDTDVAQYREARDRSNSGQL
jgi:chromosome segregation ATPase